MNRSTAPARRHRSFRLALALAVLIPLGAGCATAAAGTQRPPLVLLADGHGAVLLDPATGALLGYDRDRGRVWQDDRIGESMVNAVCLRRCPDAVVSSVADEGGRNVPPVRISAAGRAPLRLSTEAHIRVHIRVLSARAENDAVVEEGDAAGRSWLTIVRPDGRTRLDVPYRGYRWAESADRNTAIAFAERPGVLGARLLWFHRGPGGWQAAGDGGVQGTASAACPAGEAGSVLLAGQHPSIVPRRGADPVPTGTGPMPECVAGARAMALIERSFGGDGTYETIVQGIDRRGSATWRRRLPVEAGVTAHPFGPYIGLSDGTTFVLLDATGREVRRLDGVRTAAFTADGELMTVTSDDAVEWLPSDHFPQ